MISEKKQREYANEIIAICESYNINYNLQIVENIVYTSVEAKTSINHVFGLTEENDFRSARTLTDYGLSSLLQRLEKQIALLFIHVWNWDISTENFKFDWANNRVIAKKQEMKISKLISKLVGGEITNNFDLVENVENTLESIYQYFNFHWHCLGCVDVARLFEFIKNINFNFVISTNPVDIMTASYNCSFSSCYKPRGEYCASTQSFLIDPYTAITYITKHNDIDLKKIGRAWIHMLLPERVFELSKPYGTYPHSLTYYMRNVFENIAGKFLKCDFNKTIFSNASYGTFIDNTDTVVYWDSSHPDNSVTKYKQIEPYAPVCFACGEMHDNSRSWVCFECDNVAECSECGEMCFIDNMGCDSIGRNICIDCLDSDYYFCDRCCEYISNEVENIDVYGEIWCINCFSESGYILCECCESIIDTNIEPYYYLLSEYNIHVSNGADIACESCAFDYLIQCPLCDEIVAQDNFDYDFGCCWDCIYEHYIECTKCYNLITKDEAEENGGYCENCYKIQRDAI